MSLGQTQSGKVISCMLVPDNFQFKIFLIPNSGQDNKNPFVLYTDTLLNLILALCKNAIPLELENLEFKISLKIHLTIFHPFRPIACLVRKQCQL